MSMIAWYPMIGSAEDSLGKTEPSASNLSFGRSGKIGSNAPDFNGTSTVIDTGLEQSSLGRNFSVSAWVFADTISNYRDAIGRHNWSGSYGGFCFCECNGTAVTFWLGDSSRTISTYVASTLAANEWHHFAMVVSDLKTVTVYKDGSLVGSSTMSSSEMNPIGTILIGKSYNDTNRFWDGSIQDIRIYDHCLSAHEAKDLSKACILNLDFSDPYAEPTTNVVPNGVFAYRGYWGNMTATLTSGVSIGSADSSIGLPFDQCQKFEVVGSSSGGGTHMATNNITILPSTTYAYSYFIKASDSFSYTNQNMLYRYESDSSNTIVAEGGSYSSSRIQKYANGWERIWGTFTTKSTTSYINLNAYFYPTDSITYLVGGIQLEQKDHPTPFVDGARDDSIEYDNSGFKRNGVLNSKAYLSSQSGTERMSVYLGSSTNPTDNSNANIGSVTVPLSFGNQEEFTIVYRKYTATTGYQSGGNFFIRQSSNGGYGTDPVHEYDGSVHFKGSDGSSGYLASNYYTSGEWDVIAYVFDNGQTKYYLNGTQMASGSITSSTSNSFDSLTIGYSDAGGGYRKANAYFSYFLIYATALSAEDIKKEYETSQLIDKGDGIEARDILETGDNIAFCVDDGIASKTWGLGIGISPEGSTTVNGTNGLTNYTQANCQVTLTDDGYRIYRTPNIVYDSTKGWGGGTSSWGGLRWQPFAYSDKLIQKDHSYVIMFHVHGFSDNAMSESPLVWRNEIGWPGGGLIPTPTNESRHTVPANFNGDMECYYAFTVSDDIYKTCTSNYDNAHTVGTKYLSYRDFCAGFGYSSTGTNGTDIYITNFRMYDVTGWTDDKVQMLKNGTLEALSVSEDDSLGNDSPVAIYKDGNVSAKRIKTF